MCGVGAAAMLLGAAMVPVRAQVVTGDRAAIRALLDRRSAAILSNDEDAFMATIARSSRAFVARQRRLFENMRGLPLGTYRLTARWDRYGDLATREDRTLYPGAESVVIPVTEERYRLDGYDRAEAVEDLFYTFVERDGEWKIAEDTDLDDLTFYSTRHPWDYSPLHSERNGHFLLLTPECAGCPEAPTGTLSLAERALDRVESYWRPAWHKRVPLVIPPGADELKRMLQATFDVGNFVAFAYSSVDTDNGLDYTGHRVLLNPDSFAGRATESTVDILAHELLHVASRDVSGPFVPIFVEEGIAEYVGNEADPGALAYLDAEIAAGRFTGRLPEGFEFTIGTSADIFGAYQRAYSAVRFFIERWGTSRFARFYRILGRAEIVPGTARYHLDRALEKTTGAGAGAFERAWASSIDAS
jgi:hypothetical protein